MAGWRMDLRAIGLTMGWAVSGLAMASPGPSPDVLDAFVADVASSYDLPADDVRATLAGATFQQSIIDAITRPAEAKPWKDYRPIFITDQRINSGRAFIQTHREALAKVEADTGVPASMVAAILGVETSYGRITGSHKVLDALYTLCFGYPKRAEFFCGELKQVFALAREEQLDLATIKGSYAGAMGWGQFMPSSYRAYAVDGDGDGRRDLFGSLPDVFASVANYFIAHGWTPGDPVAVPALREAGGEVFEPGSLEAKFSLADLGNRGYRPKQALGHDLPATVLNLDGRFGAEHWITFKNFWVISRYNRSPLYSLAVHQLSEMLAAPESPGAQP